MERLEAHVRRELARFGPSGAMPAVLEAWVAVVGETVARNAWPARIARDGTLHVATASSSWALELAQLELEILSRLRAALGETAPPRLRFAPGLLPEPAALEPSGQAGAPQRLGPEEEARARALTAGIEDPELRARVARAAALSLAAASSGRRF